MARITIQIEDVKDAAGESTVKIDAQIKNAPKGIIIDGEQTTPLTDAMKVADLALNYIYTDVFKIEDPAVDAEPKKEEKSPLILTP